MAFPDPIEPAKVAAAHERWYSKQPYTICQRCDREFPNTDNGLTVYCSQECELGWFEPCPDSAEQKQLNHARKTSSFLPNRRKPKRYNSHRSKWS